MSAPSREHLHELLRQAVGAETAVALMSFMPPSGWGDLATKADLEHMQERMNTRFGAVNARIDSLEQRMEGRFETIDARFEEMAALIQLSEQRVLAAVRGELIGALATQTRAIIFSMVGGLVGLGGFATALARLG